MSRVDQESERFINDFVFRDARIGSHPKIRASVAWIEKGALSFSDGISVFEVPLQRSLAGRAVAFRQVSDLWETELRELRDMQHFPSIRSMLCVPLLGDTDPCGVLDLFSLERAFFSDADIGRAQLLAAILVYLRLRPKALRSHQSIALGRALKGAREELGLTQAQLAIGIGTSRIALSQWERGSWPPSTGPLYEWCSALGLTLPERRALVSVVDVTSVLLRVLREDPNQLLRLSPSEFERFVAERIDRMGFDVTLTGPTNQRDGGIDLIAIPRVRTVSGRFSLLGRSNITRLVRGSAGAMSIVCWHGKTRPSGWACS